MALYILSCVFSIENCFGASSTNTRGVDSLSSIDPAILAAILGGIVAGGLTVVASIVTVVIPFRKKINEDLHYRRIAPSCMLINQLLIHLQI